MPDGIALLGYLPFIQVGFAIPFSGEVVLVAAPGNTCHKMCLITPVTPRLHPLFKGHIRTVVCPVHNGHISSYIGHGFPMRRSLEGGLFSMCIFNERTG